MLDLACHVVQDVGRGVAMVSGSSKRITIFVSLPGNELGGKHEGGLSLQTVPWNV